MKKYVYSKGAETVTVETDGLNKIDNFIVTGLIGNNYGGLVSSGLDLKMGDKVSIPKLMNLAKVCKCKLEAYEGNKLIIDESVDFTGGEPELPGIIFGLKLDIAFNEATYNSIVPESYRAIHSYEDSKNSLPWLVANFKKIEKEGGDGSSTFDVQVFADQRQLELRGNTDTIGTLSADKKTLTTNVFSYIMFDIVKDLAITRPEKVNWFTIRFIYGGKTYESKVFVSML